MQTVKHRRCGLSELTFHASLYVLNYNFIFFILTICAIISNAYYFNKACERKLVARKKEVVHEII